MMKNKQTDKQTESEKSKSISKTYNEHPLAGCLPPSLGAFLLLSLGIMIF